MHLTATGCALRPQVNSNVRGITEVGFSRAISLILGLCIYSVCADSVEPPSVCDLATRPGELAMHGVEGSQGQNGDRQIAADIDGDGLSDKISWFDPGSGSLIPADPSTVTVTLSSAGKTFTLEEQRLYVVKYESSYFVVTGWFESERGGPLHTDIYAITGTGIIKICSFSDRDA